MDAIRETVVQACITAISSQTPYSLQLRAVAEDINVNHHLAPVASSEHSFTSPKTDNSWSRQRWKTCSRIKTDDFLLHRSLDDRHKKLPIHHRARTNPYPLSNHVRRIPVSDQQVPWSYEWAQYQPAIFTSEQILVNPGADPGSDTLENRLCL